MKTSYEEAKKARKYLWTTYCEADDMTGGYVGSEDLEKLLERPTRTQARDCLARQIAYWLEAGPDDHTARQEGWTPRQVRADPTVRDIAARFASGIDECVLNLLPEQ